MFTVISSIPFVIAESAEDIAQTRLVYELSERLVSEGDLIGADTLVGNLKAELELTPARMEKVLSFNTDAITSN